MARPFFNYSARELEAEFARHNGDKELLHLLLDELNRRSTDRALRLKAQVEAALQTPGRNENASRSRPGRVDPPPPPPQTPFPEVTNAPDAILEAWTALEVLSPPGFRKPEDLAGGDRRLVAWLDRERLPWEGDGEKPRPNTRLYYQVVLGSVDLEGAVGQLLARYSDSRPELPAARGKAVLAVLILDRYGRPVEQPVAAVSSFGWGVARALQGSLAGLSEWRIAERSIVEPLSEMLRSADAEEAEIQPLNREDIDSAYQWLLAALGLPDELAAPPQFAIRCYEYFKSPGPPEPLVVNSFFLKDLATAKSLFAEGRANTSLRRYLGVEVPPARRDLLQDNAALEAAIAPKLTPPARWPGPGRHPLVLLQQAAVNLAFHELETSGILAVNGPPGTGKTTLLRDIVAGLVTFRAEAMLGFDDPADAFVHSGEKLRAGSAWLHMYRLDERLKGYEMMVASSNNKAVENVSAELPGLKAIAQDASDLRYFTTLSDGMRDSETWGLIAAVLGNAANRSRFKQTFWWDEDLGLSTYLASASGTPQVIEKIDPLTKKVEARPPIIVVEEDAPESHEEALRRWQRARAQFRTKLNESRKALAELEATREMVASLPALAETERKAAENVDLARGVEARCQAEHESSCERLTQIQEEADLARTRLSEHDRTSPGFWARLFHTRRAREWRSIRGPLVKSCESAGDALVAASQASAASSQQLRAAEAKRVAAEQILAEAASRHSAVSREVARARDRMGAGFVDSAFFARGHADKHKSTPWLNAEQQRARDEVFIAAIKLHKAFVDAAAKPLRHNLGALMNVFGGRALPTAEKRALVADLWSTLFLVVPLISTTFASVERMLGALPPSSLGWLLIDEAGQALPQAAVGALFRTRRAVVVGDPVQIEPVVVLPDTLTQSICRSFGVDPDRFNAPSASVQTLADSATPYFTEFQGKHGSRSVGVPLLVHRRCAEPMFGISNAIAYERLMVNAKPQGTSRIGEILGPSSWIHVEGRSEEKWCPEEGDAALELLRQLALAGLAPDIYLVTPFVTVAEHLRRQTAQSGVLSGWTDDPRLWTSTRIGTVHTVQGREAEAVILVLGAPAANQTGARNWAGQQPNLLNVAVTRAKEHLYVIGNRRLWREAGRFRDLDARLP